MKKQYKNKLMILSVILAGFINVAEAVDCDATLASGMDFSGCELPGVVVPERTNLSGIILRGADLSGAVLRNVNLRGAILENATLDGADMTGADIDDATLTNTQMHSIIGINSLHFADARDVRGVDLSDNIFNSGVGKGMLVNFSSSKDYTGAKFNNTIFWGVWLGYANLTNAQFQNAKIFNSLLINANLNGANFEYALIGRDSKFDNEYSDFTGADVSNANFRWAKILVNTKGFKKDDKSMNGFKASTKADFSYARWPNNHRCMINSVGDCK